MIHECCIYGFVSVRWLLRSVFNVFRVIISVSYIFNLFYFCYAGCVGVCLAFSARHISAVLVHFSRFALLRGLLQRLLGVFPPWYLSIWSPGTLG